jgi:ketosteroid isomerase-like protein
VRIPFDLELRPRLRFVTRMPLHPSFRSLFPTRSSSRPLIGSSVRSTIWPAIKFVTPILLLLSGLAAQKLEAAPAPVPRAQRHEYRHEIDQLEDAWRNAMLKGNSAVLESLLADDYTGITAMGVIQTKEQTLDILKSGTLQLTAISISDRKVRIYGTTAVVTSLAELTGSRNDQERSGRYRYTRVYVRNSQGQWKIVSFEASRIQEFPDRK